MYDAKKLKELMSQKDDKQIDPMYKDAKMKMLGELHKMATDMMGEDVKGLKKVTVAAKDNTGLQEGLKKAEDIVGKSVGDIGHHDLEDEDMEKADAMMEDVDGEPDEDDVSPEQASNDQHLSPEEEAHLQMLLKKKKGLKA